MNYLVSALAGFSVGLLYAAINVRSPAPPVLALLGLLGMLLGEQAGRQAWAAVLGLKQTTQDAAQTSAPNRSDDE